MITNRYEVWDKESNIYTPSGEMFTPEKWIERYTWITNPIAIPIIAGGMFNGAFCGELSQMVDMYERMGADFSLCTNSRDILDTIEAFEDEMNKPIPDDGQNTAEERIATALEFQNILQMPDINLDNPEED